MTRPLRGPKAICDDDSSDCASDAVVPNHSTCSFKDPHHKTAQTVLSSEELFQTLTTAREQLTRLHENSTTMVSLTLQNRLTFCTLDISPAPSTAAQDKETSGYFLWEGYKIYVEVCQRPVVFIIVSFGLVKSAT